VYPEYTGTLAQEILSGEHLEGEEALREALARRGVVMSRSLGFNDTYALDLVGLEVAIDYDAAGALTDNTVPLTLYLTRYQNYGSFDQNIVMDLIPWQTVATATLNYRFSLGGFVRGTAVVNPQLPSIHVPKGDRLQLVIGRLTGGVFPSNTMVTIQAHAFTSTPQVQEPWDPTP